MLVSALWASLGAIWYTYVGYPLLLSALARLRSPQRPGVVRLTPTITLVIAAYNEKDVIAEKLENSVSLEYPRDRLQIVVAADGSDDGTELVAQGYAQAGVETSYSPIREGKAAAINRAMARATGEIIVFSDANNVYEAAALRELVAPFIDPTLGAVTGAKRIHKGDGALGESEGLYWRYESYVKAQESRLGCCIAVAGEIFAVRRELWEPVPASIINDDFYTAMRIVRRGYRIAYAPRARSYERVSLSQTDEVARRTRIAAGRYQAMALAPGLLPWHRPLLIWQIVSHKFMRPVVPFAMIVAFLSNAAIVASFVPSPPRLAGGRLVYQLLLSLQLLFYLVAALGQRVQGIGTLGSVLYLPAFLVSSNFAALRGFFQFLTRRQTPLWHRVHRRIYWVQSYERRSHGSGVHDG